MSSSSSGSSSSLSNASSPGSGPEVSVILTTGAGGAITIRASEFRKLPSASGAESERPAPAGPEPVAGNPVQRVPVPAIINMWALPFTAASREDFWQTNLAMSIHHRTTSHSVMTSPLTLAIAPRRWIVLIATTPVEAQENFTMRPCKKCGGTGKDGMWITEVTYVPYGQDPDVPLGGTRRHYI